MLLHFGEDFPKLINLDAASDLEKYHFIRAVQEHYNSGILRDYRYNRALEISSVKPLGRKEDRATLFGQFPCTPTCRI